MFAPQKQSDQGNTKETQIPADSYPPEWRRRRELGTAAGEGGAATRNPEAVKKEQMNQGPATEDRKCHIGRPMGPSHYTGSGHGQDEDQGEQKDDGSQTSVTGILKTEPEDIDRLKALSKFSPVFNTITQGARVDIQVEQK